MICLWENYDCSCSPYNRLELLKKILRMMFQYQNLETQLNFIYLLKKKPLQQFFFIGHDKTYPCALQ